MTRLDEIKKHASPAGELRMRNAGKTFDINCATCRERWLLARVGELEAALTDALDTYEHGDACRPGQCECGLDRMRTALAKLHEETAP